MEAPFPTPNPAPPPAVAPARAPAPAVPRFERVGAGLLFLGDGLYWSEALGSTSPAGLFGDVIEAGQSFFRNLRTGLPSLTGRDMWIGFWGMEYSLALLVLVLAVQAFARMCGFDGWMPRRAFWGWASLHALAYLASQIGQWVSYGTSYLAGVSTWTVSKIIPVPRGYEWPFFLKLGCSLEWLIVACAMLYLTRPRRGGTEYSPGGAGEG